MDVGSGVVQPSAELRCSFCGSHANNSKFSLTTASLIPPLSSFKVRAEFIEKLDHISMTTLHGVQCIFPSVVDAVSCSFFLVFFLIGNVIIVKIFITPATAPCSTKNTFLGEIIE